MGQVTCYYSTIESRVFLAISDTALPLYIQNALKKKLTEGNEISVSSTKLEK